MHSSRNHIPSDKTYQVCGVNITRSTPILAAETIVDSARLDESFQVHLCNTFTLSLVRKDRKMREALAAADLNLPDGTPVAWLNPVQRRTGPVRGPGLVHRVFEIEAARDVQHYMYGGAPGVADVMAERLTALYPESAIVGVETPPYKQLDESEIKELGSRIQAAKAQSVWIGLGTPKQDYLVHRLAGYTSATLVPVGAAFDFISGTVSEAPRVLHGSGLEWSYRLLRDPRRLWRRYLFGSARFVTIEFGSRLRRAVASWMAIGKRTTDDKIRIDP